MKKFLKWFGISVGSLLSIWKEGDFIKVLRTGVTPASRQLDPAQMPWEHYKYFSDDEMKAIFLYLNPCRNWKQSSRRQIYQNEHGLGDAVSSRPV